MNTNKESFKKTFIKIGINSFVFITTIIVLAFTNLPKILEEEISFDNFKIMPLIKLILYRLSMYFIYPIIVSIIEKVKNKEKMFKIILFDNFNIQFLSFTLISSLYCVLGLDVLFNTEIFNSLDYFLFIGSFIFTLICNKKILNLIGE